MVRFTGIFLIWWVYRHTGLSLWLCACCAYKCFQYKIDKEQNRACELLRILGKWFPGILKGFLCARGRCCTSVTYFTTHGTSLWKTRLLTSANEIAHEKCGRATVMWYNFGRFQSHTAQKNPFWILMNAFRFVSNKPWISTHVVDWHVNILPQLRARLWGRGGGWTLLRLRNGLRLRSLHLPFSLSTFCWTYHIGLQNWAWCKLDDEFTIIITFINYFYNKSH